MESITIFGLTFKINPIAFTIPFLNWDIYWYGILITVGFLLAVIFAAKNAKRFDLTFDQITDCLIIVLPIAIICARLYYMIFDGTPITQFFSFSSGHGFSGLAIYGGVIGTFVALFFVCKFKKINILDIIDITSLGFLIGQGIGRWGNFCNQEAYGAATGSSWFGMTGSIIEREMGKGVLVHPCFLYESVWCLLSFFIINKITKKRKFKGEAVLLYLAFYGFERTIVEGFRTDSLMLGNIRVSQLLSALLCIASVTALIIICKKINSKAENDKLSAASIITGEAPEVINETEEKAKLKEDTDIKTVKTQNEAFEETENKNDEKNKEKNKKENKKGNKEDLS